ncbi:MAG TPA: DUF3180 domain-containing protein [Pseudonocardiaceae bacterium]|jgi:hypothetical protein
MRFTRPRDLLIPAVLTGLLVDLLLRIGYEQLPPLPTLAGSSLGLLAVIEAVFGYSLRARIARRPGTRPVAALTAARAVALAKASSLLGAIMLGGWLAVIVYALPKRDQFPAAGSDTTSAIIGACCAAALIAAALWLEYCCRTPGRPDEPLDDEQRRHAA